MLIIGAARRQPTRVGMEASLSGDKPDKHNDGREPHAACKDTAWLQIQLVQYGNTNEEHDEDKDAYPKHQERSFSCHMIVSPPEPPQPPGPAQSLNFAAQSLGFCLVRGALLVAGFKKFLLSAAGAWPLGAAWW